MNVGSCEFDSHHPHIFYGLISVFIRRLGSLFFKSSPKKRGFFPACPDIIFIFTKNRF